MKISDFIKESREIIKEVVPGDFNIKDVVSNDGYSFSISMDIYYNPESECILSSTNKILPIYYMEVTLGDDFEYKIVSNSIFPKYEDGAGKNKPPMKFPEFLKILRELLEEKKAQIILKSISGE